MAARGKGRKLTPKQAAFVREYLIDHNATQAAIRAGYAPKSADSAAAQLVANHKVSAAIRAEEAKVSQRTAIDQDWVRRRLAALADFELREACVWDDRGLTLKPSDELSESSSRGISGIKFSKDGGIEIKTDGYGRSKALDTLAKHTGLIDTRPEGTEGDVVGIIWQKKAPSDG